MVISEGERLKATCVHEAGHVLGAIKHQNFNLVNHIIIDNNGKEGSCCFDNLEELHPNVFIYGAATELMFGTFKRISNSLTKSIIQWGWTNDFNQWSFYTREFDRYDLIYHRALGLSRTIDDIDVYFVKELSSILEEERFVVSWDITDLIEKYYPNYCPF